MLTVGKTYEAVYNSFKWQIPEYYNIGIDICDKWASDKNRLALIYEDEKGGVEKYSFADLKDLSNKLANGLRASDVKPGDRIGILLPQCPETAISHIATYKIGGIAIPLFVLFGADALLYRLQNSGAKVVITNSENLPKILEIRDKLPLLETVVVTGGETPSRVVNFQKLIEKGSKELIPVSTKADDPALIIYTSGTTGPPKGALHAHRTLLGHIPGVEFPHNFFPKKGDLFWTPADWAWIGGLIDVLLPSWHHGVPVLAYRAKKFDPDQAFFMIAKHQVKNAFIPPTALKMMRQEKNPGKRHTFKMRSIGSGGETLGEELLDWGRETMGVTINEFYGQTECNLVIGCCADVMEVRPGSMGKAIPGKTVAVVNEAGQPVAPGTIGEIAVKQPDPVMFIEYWKNPGATANKYINDWLLTGDMASLDEDGYFWFNGRSDDIITSSGYRIGPTEIEDCLMKHPSVAMVAVIGVPDVVRTEIVKAFIVLKPEETASPELEEDIKSFVKTRLAAHEYPRKIKFVKELPMTATGKIMRRKLKEEGD